MDLADAFSVAHSERVAEPLSRRGYGLEQIDTQASPVASRWWDLRQKMFCPVPLIGADIEHLKCFRRRYVRDDSRLEIGFAVFVNVSDLLAPGQDIKPAPQAPHPTAQP
jgi:hypothetical protein